MTVRESYRKGEDSPVQPWHFSYDPEMQSVPSTTLKSALQTADKHERGMGHEARYAYVADSWEYTA